LRGPRSPRQARLGTRSVHRCCAWGTVHRRSTTERIIGCTQPEWPRLLEGLRRLRVTRYRARSTSG
jgi:hypothetical protein